MEGTERVPSDQGAQIGYSSDHVHSFGDASHCVAYDTEGGSAHQFGYIHILLENLQGVKGHVWYLATLLLFDILESIRPYIHTPYTDREIIANLGLNIVLSFLRRLVYPVVIFSSLFVFSQYTSRNMSRRTSLALLWTLRQQLLLAGCRPRPSR